MITANLGDCTNKKNTRGDLTTASMGRGGIQIDTTNKNHDILLCSYLFCFFFTLRPLKSKQSDSNSKQLERNSKIEDSRVLGYLKYKIPIVTQCKLSYTADQTVGWGTRIGEPVNLQPVP